MNTIMKRDIANRDDVILLVDTFYSKVRVNPVIGFIFKDVANVNWTHHLPKMYDFWSSILLKDHSYSGNPMKIHIDLSKITPLTEVEFIEWLQIFNATVDELFSGEGADLAKFRARTTAGIMLYKIQAHDEVSL